MSLSISWQKSRELFSPHEVSHPMFVLYQVEDRLGNIFYAHQILVNNSKLTMAMKDRSLNKWCRSYAVRK